MILYNLHTIPGSTSFRINKFDNDFNFESAYDVDATNCTCPQGHKPTCRHRKMLGAMLSILDTEFFYCFDDSKLYDASGTCLTITEPELTKAMEDKGLIPQQAPIIAQVLSPGQRFRRL